MRAWAEEPPATAGSPAQSSQEIVSAIIHRAQQILEDRRRANRLQISKEISQGIGYESNPSSSSSHVGDTFLESSLYLLLSKKLTPTLTWQGTSFGSFTNYLEYGDGDYFFQTVTPLKLLWKPRPTWRLEGGVELAYLYFPKDASTNYREIKPFLGIRQNLWADWFHSARYESFVRDYISSKAADGAGRETLSGRIDTRHRLRYELGTVWKGALIKIRQEGYLHDSNDAQTDLYDTQNYKIGGLIDRPITQKSSLAASYSFERKNYEHRTVSGIAAEARYDDTQTWGLTFTYDFNPTWSCTSSFSYRFLNSNDPASEYTNVLSSTALTARF